MLFQMTATHRDTYFDASNVEKVQGVEFSLTVDTAEQAKEIAARFPKSVKVRGCVLQASGGGERGYVVLSINLTANGVNGGVNETGIKRYKAFLAAAKRLGHTIEYVKPYANSVNSVERFHTMLGIEDAR